MDWRGAKRGHVFLAEQFDDQAGPGSLGTSRQFSTRRSWVQILIAAVSRSRSVALIARISLTLTPVRARVRTGIWSAGFGTCTAAAMKRLRSPAARYWWPLASMSWAGV